MIGKHGLSFRTDPHIGEVSGSSSSDQAKVTGQDPRPILPTIKQVHADWHDSSSKRNRQNKT